MSDKQKIMIVDDEQHILDFYSTVLTNNGYECVCYTNAEDALEDLDDTVDLLITDNRMPGMTGIEFLEEVIEEHEDLAPDHDHGVLRYPGTDEQHSC